MSGDHPDPPIMYPIAKGEGLRIKWIKRDIDATLDSRFRSLSMVSDEAGMAGFVGDMLWLIAVRQDPPGTLPDDDRELTFLAGFGSDIANWRRLREGALYGWRPCIVQGPEGPIHGRLYHRTLMATLVELREQYAAGVVKMAERVRYQRLRRVKMALPGTGLSKRAAESDVMAERVLAHLEERGQRLTALSILRAVEHISGRNVVEIADFNIK